MCETYRAIGLGIALLCLGSSRAKEEASLVHQGIRVLKHSLDDLDPSDIKAKQFRELLTATIAPKLPESPSKSSGCFIATAACGNPFDHDVLLLSEFRDAVLGRSRMGRVAVASYYAISPPIAAQVERFAVLRYLTRSLLVRPAVACIQWMGIIRGVRE